MKILAALVLTFLTSIAFAYEWDKDVETLCTDPNLQVGGEILAIMVPKPSPLYYATMDMALGENYCPEGIECERQVDVHGSQVRSTGAARTMQHGASGFTFPEVVIGEYKMRGSVRTIDFDPNATFRFRATYGGQVIASGPVTRLCQRVIGGTPKPEMILEYLKEPTGKPSYLRFRQGQVKP